MDEVNNISIESNILKRNKSGTDVGKCVNVIIDVSTLANGN